MAFIVAWLLSLLWTADRSWVNESWERVGDEVIHRTNYFDLDRRPLTVFMTVILFGYLAYLFRRTSLAVFGVTEFLAGTAGAYLVLRHESLTSLSTWLALAGALYLIGSGFENMASSPKESALRSAPPA
ncbi:MAG: hypothetical protein ACJ8GN_08955 [Longimicrobiaceae bacterium]